VTVIGQGFRPESVVMIMWSSSTGSVAATTNSAGQLRATLMILVPDVIGPREAIARGYEASAPFLVVSSSSQPGGSDDDVIYRTEGG
jgi:hypothetical protein